VIGKSDAVASGLRLAAGGVALGLAVALPLSRVMGDFLFGIEATDPRVYTAIAVSVGLSKRGYRVRACEAGRFGRSGIGLEQRL